MNNKKKSLPGLIGCRATVPGGPRNKKIKIGQSTTEKNPHQLNRIKKQKSVNKHNTVASVWRSEGRPIYTPRNDCNMSSLLVTRKWQETLLIHTFSITIFGLHVGEKKLVIGTLLVSDSYQQCLLLMNECAGHQLPHSTSLGINSVPFNSISFI